MAFDAPLQVRFRRSLYLTLALACAALGYAELTFLPEMAAFTAVVVALLVVAYRAEGRWVLGSWAANVIGATIGAASLGWVTYQFFRPWGGTLLDQLPWPTSLLPYLGPMLMILIPAKLFRPKHEGDFWGLQGIGLMAVALGCALAGDATFAGLTLAYLANLIWSLTLFYLVREGERRGVALGRARPARTIQYSIRWLAGVFGLALCLFLATPRNGDGRWELVLNGGRLQTGIDERTQIDLNKSGTVTPNRDLLYEVVAKTFDGQLKTDLDPSQRWRSTHFNHYEAGRWEMRQEFMPEFRKEFRREQLFVRKPPEPLPAPEVGDLPLEPSEFTLEFRAQRGAPGRIHAEPITNRRPHYGISQLAPGRGGRVMPWFNPAESELQVAGTGGGGRAPYHQIVTPTGETGVRPALRIDDAFREFHCECTSVPEVHKYSSQLVRRYIDEGKLPTTAWNPTTAQAQTNEVPPELAERVAHSLATHLSASGNFRYTLDLVRGDDQLDPVEDFLKNTKSGHCNRFASALTLMLRSQGIPARIVLGFYGYETQGNGTYEIRQCHAHSWVEALIRREENGQPVWKWLTLDPTPTGEVAQAAAFNLGNWWEATRVSLVALFRNFIIEYDTNQQVRAVSAFSGAVVGSVLGVAALGAAALAVSRRLRRRTRPADASPAPFYGRLLAVIARRLGLTQEASQTPAEFAGQVGNRLGPNFADLPGEAVVAYYRVRYGGERLVDGERSRLDARIAGLDAALANPKAL